MAACAGIPALPSPSRAQPSHAPARLAGVFREIMHGRSLVPQPGLTQPGPAACLTPPVSKHAPAGTSPARFLRRPYARAQIGKWHRLAPGSGCTCLVK